MHTVLGQINLFLSTAISATLVYQLSRLSPVLYQTSTALLLLAVLFWVGAFIADDWACRKFKISIELYRFVMIAIAAAVLTGLVMPMVPNALAWLGV
jgi:MFS-type transporter involved in bile tolerance (Atg22 family)